MLEPIAVALAVVSAMAFAAVVVLVVLTSRESSRPALVWLRPLAVVVTGTAFGLTCAYAAPLARALSMLALLFAVLGQALAWGMPISLEQWARRHGLLHGDGEESSGAWWHEFERAFHRYADGGSGTSPEVSRTSDEARSDRGRRR